MYASAPDDAFVLGTLSDTPQVVLACGFSGHGFKFGPVIGDIAADLVLEGKTARDVSHFAAARLATSHVPGDHDHHD